MRSKASLARGRSNPSVDPWRHACEIDCCRREVSKQWPFCYDHSHDLSEKLRGAAFKAWFRYRKPTDLPEPWEAPDPDVANKWLVVRTQCNRYIRAHEPDDAD